jgi:tRNA(Arg) A34 adenosine deaminase TadA
MDDGCVTCGTCAIPHHIEHPNQDATSTPTDHTQLQPPPTRSQVAQRLLDVIENDIVPLTNKAVQRGDKIFGAALLRKSNLSLILAATNAESECPLWHGEIEAIRKYHELPAACRPPPKDVLFLATHEPCSLCLSAISFSGFDNFYYFFSHESSRDDFTIPHDLRILKEVFGCKDGAYRTKNAYWSGYSIADLVASCLPEEVKDFAERIDRLQQVYAAMSDVYQATKGSCHIPLP